MTAYKQNVNSVISIYKNHRGKNSTKIHLYDNSKRKKTCIQIYATGFLLIFFIKGKGWHQLFTIKISYTHMIDTYFHFCTTNNFFHGGFLKAVFHWLDKHCLMYMRDAYGELFLYKNAGANLVLKWTVQFLHH